MTFHGSKAKGRGSLPVFLCATTLLVLSIPVGRKADRTLPSGAGVAALLLMTNDCYRDDGQNCLLQDPSRALKVTNNGPVLSDNGRPCVLYLTVAARPFATAEFYDFSWVEGKGSWQSACVSLCYHLVGAKYAGGQ